MKTCDVSRLTLSLLFVLVSCANYTESGNLDNPASLYADQPANVRISLTDKPSSEIKSVIVNIKQMELVVEGAASGKSGRLVFGKEVGSIDLLTLQNGVTLPIQDLTIPEGVLAKQIRLVLEYSGNYIIKDNDTTCELKTPSAQHSGVKIIFKTPIGFENNYNYSLVVDFDAEKSIVLQGNGGCLLKPVLKVIKATRIPMDGLEDNDSNQDTENTDDEEQLTDGTDQNEMDWDTNPDGLPDELPVDDFSGIF